MVVALRNIAFIVVGATIAYLNMRSEIEHMAGTRLIAQGRYEEAFLKHVRASAYFPAIYYVREAHAALNGVANFLPPVVTLEVIDAALRADPLNGGLLWYKIAQELRHGGFDEALKALEKLERVGPKWPETDNARKLFDALKGAVDEERRKASDGGLS